MTTEKKVTKKKAGRVLRDELLSVRVDASIMARVERVRVVFQRDAPPGMMISESDALRGIVERGLLGYEGDEKRARAKVLPRRENGAATGDANGKGGG